MASLCACKHGIRDALSLGLEMIRNAADVILTFLFGRYAGTKNYLEARLEVR